MINLRSYLRQNMMRFDALCFAKNEEIHLVLKYAAKRQPQGLRGKIVLRGGISSFTKVSP